MFDGAPIGIKMSKKKRRQNVNNTKRVKEAQVQDSHRYSELTQTHR